MFLHRKETERLSNPWWWRPMQVLCFVLILPAALILQFPLFVFGVFDEVIRYLYNWNRCQISMRPRHPWERWFEPKRGKEK